MKSIHLIICMTAAVLAPESASPQVGGATKLTVPIPDVERGRSKFATKGCVVCHSINGIGGRAGPPLDAALADGTADPVGFAARMWRGAAAMTLLQSMEFGYQISLSGQDIADLAAFVADPDERAMFSEDDIPEIMLGWTIDEPFDALEQSWDPWGIDAALGEVEAERVGNITRGHMLAERWCTTCHVIDANGEGGDAGPAFSEVAVRAGSSEKMIMDWLSAPHPGMPEFLVLGDHDFGDLAAYIMSLKP